MELTESFAAIRPSIVALGSRFSPTIQGQRAHFPPIVGTGFIVDSRGIVATNRHVAEALRKLPKHPMTGQSSALAIIFLSVSRSGDGHEMGILLRGTRKFWTLEEFSAQGPYYGEALPDIAFLELDVKNLPAVSLATEPNTIQVGLSVATAGFPLGREPLIAHQKITQLMPFLRRGIVSSVFPFPCPNPHGFTVDVTTQGGASGSPIFLEGDPRVVGMVAANFEGGPNITLAIPATMIADGITTATDQWEDSPDKPTLESLVALPHNTDLNFERLGVVRLSQDLFKAE